MASKLHRSKSDSELVVKRYKQTDIRDYLKTKLTHLQKSDSGKSPEKGNFNKSSQKTYKMLYFCPVTEETYTKN